jgi:mannose-6-phosphate isomerase
MTGQLKTASSQSTEPQPEILYGTTEFQVRLWTIPVTEVIDLTSQDAAIGSQAFLIAGQLTLDDTVASKDIAIGQHLSISPSGCWKLKNSGNTPATLLEVFQGQNLVAFPLAEVTETRPWGSFTVLKDEPHYKLKQLMAKPGNRLSLQRHQKREEHWIVIQGQPEITLDESHILLKSGEYIKIPRHSWHRLANPATSQNTGDNVEIIELQLGDYFGEDDIERREDDYGRA